jgi:primosomal protein N' (replication factor Y) (superfamily II helicase)
MGSTYYYEIWVGSQRYHSDKPLTYSHEFALEVGTVVSIPLQRQAVVGVVAAKANRPAFQTKAILRVLESHPLPAHLLQLLNWLRSYYPAPFGQIVALAVPNLLASKGQVATEEATDKTTPGKLPPLTNDQTQAIKDIEAASPTSVLLHGNTGTGKTRVYLELVKRCLAEGHSALILTPEIGLTPQLALAFEKSFPGHTVVMHSELGTTLRRNNWLRILRAQKPLVIIGPRSALFAPIQHVGLVVIDEFHEPSYKQEQAPYFQATRVGAKLAELHKAQLLLGSATPLVSDYYTIQQKGLPIIRLREPAVKLAPSDPVIKIIDRKDKQLFTASTTLANALIEAIHKALNENQQALVFLNRRGTSRAILCQICGWQAFCPHCDLPLTYHGDTHTMHCHTCGYNSRTPSSCPTCSANDIVFQSPGTKSVVSEIERLFPHARVKRFDSDTVRAERLEHQYISIREGAVDVLVGTQMLGKGLDLPRLAVVGIVTAEMSLTFPDYTAEERTYQLVTQALGRINRGHVAGTAIVQTYHPESSLLRAAISNDYATFYRDQLDERKEYKFPPFRFILKLTCTRASEAAAQQASMRLVKKLLQTHPSIEISGPSPAFIGKTHGRYHWQIILKATQRQTLVDIIKGMPANWSYDIDPLNLL